MSSNGPNQQKLFFFLILFIILFLLFFLVIAGSSDREGGLRIESKVFDIRKKKVADCRSQKTFNGKFCPS